MSRISLFIDGLNNEHLYLQSDNENISTFTHRTDTSISLRARYIGSSTRLGEKGEVINSSGSIIPRTINILFKNITKLDEDEGDVVYSVIINENDITEAFKSLELVPSITIKQVNGATVIIYLRDLHRFGKTVEISGCSLNFE